MSPPERDLVVRRIGRLLPMRGPVLTEAALVIRDGLVHWCGPERELPVLAEDAPEFDAGGAAVLPGFVDCHTHLVWAGSRRDEFVARLAGVGYDGGGIRTTVAATRATDSDELVSLTAARLAAAVRAGTTSVEVKTGYGLSRAEELRCLDVLARVAALAPVRVHRTYLGAHVVPADTDPDGYVAEVVDSLPAARERGAGWCDVFCDDGAFTVEQTRRILRAAKSVGLRLRMHAEQIGHTGAARLAAELGCDSADHLDHATETDARRLAAAGVVGVVLPTVALTLGTNTWHVARLLRDAGVSVALASDCNPGTSWCESVLVAVRLGCLAMGMSVDEAFRAATLGGAAALRQPDVGHLSVGARGDLVVLDAEHEADVVAHISAPGVAHTVIGGAPVAGWEGQPSG